MTQPEPLTTGDLMVITATARKISREELKPALDWIEAQGWRWELAESIEKDAHQFAGSDEIRRNALQWCLDHPEAKAIWCARGGYGTARILEDVDWTRFKENPKWVVGYSDITALHGSLQRRGYASLHATMPINVGSNSPECLTSLKSALTGTTPEMSAPSNPLNHIGIARGTLVGGNLSVLYSTLGSSSEPPLEGCILFLEDLDEYLYHIDRMMLNLGRNNWWKKLAGVVVGGMTDMNDNAIPFGESAEQIISRHLKPYGLPVGFGFPAGHIDDNRTLALGQTATLEVRSSNSVLKF